MEQGIFFPIPLGRFPFTPCPVYAIGKQEAISLKWETFPPRMPSPEQVSSSENSPLYSSNSSSPPLPHCLSLVKTLSSFMQPSNTDSSSRQGWCKLSTCCMSIPTQQATCQSIMQISIASRSRHNTDLSPGRDKWYVGICTVFHMTGLCQVL